MKVTKTKTGKVGIFLVKEEAGFLRKTLDRYTHGKGAIDLELGQTESTGFPAQLLKELKS